MATSDIGKAFRTKLLTYSAITALVGQRMYPDNLVQSATMPAIVYYKISTVRDHTISDVTKLAHSRIQMDCYGSSREGANDVAHALRNSGICAYVGTTSLIFICGVQIDSGESYSFDTPTDGSQVLRYITSFDFLVHYWEV